MADDQLNWLEQLGRKIPGYGGYAERERRRDLDKHHREHLADRLRQLKPMLTDTIRDLSGSGRLTEVGPVDRLAKKLDGVENRVRFASYGYTGFFDTVKIDDRQLQALYQFDLALVAKVDEIEAKLRDLKVKARRADELTAAAAEAENAVDQLSRAFDDRSRVIDSGTDRTSPASLFDS